MVSAARVVGLFLCSGLIGASRICLVLPLTRSHDRAAVADCVDTGEFLVNSTRKRRLMIPSESKTVTA